MGSGPLPGWDMMRRVDTDEEILGCDSLGAQKVLRLHPAHAGYRAGSVSALWPDAKRLKQAQTFSHRIFLYGMVMRDQHRVEERAGKRANARRCLAPLRRVKTALRGLPMRSMTSSKC